MKKIFLLACAMSISFSGLAQSFQEEFSASQDQGDLENQFYFRFGYSLPTTSYIGNDDPELWDYFTRNGATFELGSIFIINRAALADGLRLGINVDYAEFSFHHLPEIDAVDEFAIGIIKLASKIGPSLSFSPAKGLVFDAFFKAKIPWVGGIAMWTIDDLEETFIANPGIGFATGLNLRYRFLMVGFEFNSDKMEFESRDFPGEYFGSISDASNKTPMPSLSFTFGFSF